MILLWQDSVSTHCPLYEGQQLYYDLLLSKDYLRVGAESEVQRLEMRTGNRKLKS